jgi:hypothetical protein
MPMRNYKNRPPMKPDTTVWRYTSLGAVIAMLRDRQLRLTRLNSFDDPFEGSIPKQEIDDQVPILSGAHNVENMMRIQSHYHPDMDVPRTRHRDLWQELKERRLAKTRSAHASCWAAGDESEAMWRLYCRECGQPAGQGLALRSQLEKLESTVAQHDVVVSPIAYRFYHDDGPAFTDELDAFFHKRKGFKCEQEVRIIKFDEGHYNALTSSIAGYSEASPAAALPMHIFLDWAPATAIDAITVSPYATETYESEARQEIAAIDPAFAERIELSILSEHRYPRYI